MNRFLSAIALFLLQFSGAALADGGSESRPTILHGKTNPICQDALLLLQSTAKDEFVHGSWKGSFDRLEWRGIDLSDRTYTTLDIDNDGRSEIVVKKEATTRSVIFELIFAIRKPDFQQPKEPNDWGVLESKGYQLSPRNSVMFSNRHYAVPVFTAIWNRKKKNYLAMMEFYFAHEDQIEEGRQLPNSFFIGVLDSRSFQFDQLFKVRRLVPKMICRIVWQ
jgi:hypothetical protein